MPLHRACQGKGLHADIAVSDPPQGTVRHEGDRNVEAREGGEPSQPLGDVAAPEEHEPVRFRPRELGALQHPREGGPAPPGGERNTGPTGPRPRVGGGDGELAETVPKPRYRVAPGHGRELEPGVRLRGREGPAHPGPGAAMDLGPGWKRLGARQPVEVRRRANEPRGPSAAQAVRGQRGGGDGAGRAEQMRPACDAGHALGVPDRQRTHGRLRRRETGRAAFFQPLGAEGQLLEPAPLPLQARIERVRGRRAAAAHDARQHEVYRERRGEEGRPAPDEQSGLLAQAPHEARHSDENAERDHEPRARQPDL